jgi:Ribosomal protein L11 methylase
MVRACPDGQAAGASSTMPAFPLLSPAPMPYLELTLRCSETTQPRYENALEDVGALAVTMLDAEADTSNERAILEPGVGETPLWNELVLSALFPADADPLVLLAALEAFDEGLDWSGASFRKVEDEDWERAWLDTFKPMSFGHRTWIVPWNHELPEDAQGADAAIVRLDPGLAFGSGTHPTTALCLRWLDQLADEGRLAGQTVLDFGCGSGILALAALKLGAAAAVGVDNDPQAIIATMTMPSATACPSPATCPRTSRCTATRWWWPTSWPRRWMRWPKCWPNASPSVAASRCRASCMARRMSCWCVTRRGSNSSTSPRMATGCASTACAVLE